MNLFGFSCVCRGLKDRVVLREALGLQDQRETEDLRDPLALLEIRS